MMTLESIRTLLYPLGFVASLLFSLRFFIQWIQSEKEKKSVVPRLFWTLSIAANLTLAVHGFIQLQLPIFMIQVFGGLIAWRNLNLRSASPISTRKTLIFFVTTLSCALTLFLMQKNATWMRTPTMPLIKERALPLSLGWHVLGFLGMTLFASRFWVQWWLAEKKQESYLGASFWWISLSGGTLSLVYFLRLFDLVNVLGYGVGLVPYLRNLMLLRVKSPSSSSDAHFIFAGEQSGDVLGEALIRAFGEKATFFGVGGEKMRSAGLSCLIPMEKFHVMGFSEVIKALFRLYRHYKTIVKAILENNPRAVILIDYPDFNLFLAKRLRKKGYQGKIIHYVCPSIWAWRKKRKKRLVETLDLLLCILPFEPQLFSKETLQASYVGHPLLAALKAPLDASWREDARLQTKKPLLSLFPGSRKQEVLLNLPLQLQAAKALDEHFEIVISCANPSLEPIIETLAPNVQRISEKYRYELMNETHLALATSGTVNLELALFEVPTVVTYKINRLNYLLGRYLFRIVLPFYTLPNIILQKSVFPELIHQKIDPKEVEEAARLLLHNPTSIKLKCREIKRALGNEEASLAAARAITQTIQEKEFDALSMPLPQPKAL